MKAITPLAGLRILDLTELLPGPYATQQLAEMGACLLYTSPSPRD